MLQLFGYISAVLSIVMIIPYVRDILRLKTKPERASWLIWTVLMFIAFFSQLAKGATDSLWLTGGQTASVSIITLLSLRYGVGGLTNRDISALVGVAAGLVLWYFTREASYALFIVILIDAVGIWLTLLKTYEDPESETMSMWLISGTSAVFGALAVGSFNFILLAYPIYLILANYTVVLTMILAERRKIFIK